MISKQKFHLGGFGDSKIFEKFLKLFSKQKSGKFKFEKVKGWEI